MTTSLFEALSKFPPREGQDPLKNFITEGFAWLLNKYPDFGEFFLRYLKEKLPLNMNTYDCKWRTQVRFDDKYPDMVCYSNDERKAIVFEHKTWGSLDENQINNYRKYSEARFDDSRIVLITATRQQHEQNPDLALCWSDIYELISDWEQETNSSIPFLFKDFHKFLKIKGLGPPAHISHAGIRYCCETKDMERKLKGIRNRIIEREIQGRAWQRMIREDYKLRLRKTDAWGRMGISLWDDAQLPGVFVGILLDGEDHRTTPIDSAKGPDFCLILSFRPGLPYETNEHYQELLCRVQQRLNDGWDGWEFYNHLEAVNMPNRWHPIHIRKPLLDVFAGTEEGEEQEERFYKAASDLIRLVAEEECFWELRRYY